MSAMPNSATPNPELVALDDVMTFTEAALRWGLSDPAVLRMAVRAGRFRSGEVRKSLHVWLVTRAAMERVFGPEGSRKEDDRS